MRLQDSLSLSSLLCKWGCAHHVHPPPREPHRPGGNRRAQCGGQAGRAQAGAGAKPAVLGAARHQVPAPPRVWTLGVSATRVGSLGELLCSWCHGPGVPTWGDRAPSPGGTGHGWRPFQLAQLGAEGAGGSGGWRPGVALSTPPQHPVAPASPGPSREPRRGRSASCLALLFPVPGLPHDPPPRRSRAGQTGWRPRKRRRERKKQVPGCDLQTLRWRSGSVCLPPGLGTSSRGPCRGAGSSTAMSTALCGGSLASVLEKVARPLV